MVCGFTAFCVSRAQPASRKPFKNHNIYLQKLNFVEPFHELSVSNNIKQLVLSYLAELYLPSLPIPNSEYASYVREFLAGFEDTVATIERIDIQGNQTIPEERIRFYIQSYPGDIYAEERLKFDLRALWKSNFFDDIQVRERDGEKGKTITFVLREKPLIYSIEFAGNLAFFESEIYDALKEKKEGLTVDSRYDQEKIKAAERVIKNLMI